MGGGKWSGGGVRSYLGFSGCYEVVTSPHDSDLLLGSMAHGEDDTPVILRPR
jgi:hypothetical protein